DVARWVYVAETDAAAKRDTEAGIVRHLSHFMSAATSGYLGNVSEKDRMDTLNYDTLAATTLVHGSPETVIARLRALREHTGLTSLLLHYPPSYGYEKTMQSLRLFAERVMPLPTARMQRGGMSCHRRRSGSPNRRSLAPPVGGSPVRLLLRSTSSRSCCASVSPSTVPTPTATTSAQ